MFKQKTDCLTDSFVYKVWLNVGRIIDLQYHTDRDLVQELGEESIFGSSDYRVMVSSFLTDSLRKIPKNGPILYCINSFHPDLTAQALSFFYMGKRIYKAAINCIAVEFKQSELDGSVDLDNLPGFETFKLTLLEAPVLREAINNISQTIYRMRQYLIGEGVDEQYRDRKYFEEDALDDVVRANLVTLPGIEPGLHD